MHRKFREGLPIKSVAPLTQLSDTPVVAELLHPGARCLLQSQSVYLRVMPTYEGSDGLPLHYDDGASDGGIGEKEPIVLLAGGAARHPSYLGDLAGLSERHRLIVPHLRGVGRTARPHLEERGSFWAQADDIERLRIHLGLQRVTLVAHSAGARLAIAYATQFPRGVARLVLITPPAGYLVGEPSDTGAPSERRHGDSDFEVAFAALVAGPQTDDDDGYNTWQHESAPAGYARWGAKERAHAQVGRWSLTATKAYFSVAPPSDLASRLRQVTAPVLVLAGAEDCLTGLAPAIALARLFPSGTSAVIENSGHYPWVEQPDAFRHAIDAFLQPSETPIYPGPSFTRSTPRAT